MKWTKHKFTSNIFQKFWALSNGGYLSIKRNLESNRLCLFGQEYIDKLTPGMISSEAQIKATLWINHPGIEKFS